MMMQGKADLEVRNSSDHTPLLTAVFRGQLPVIELLVKKGKATNL